MGPRIRDKYLLTISEVMEYLNIGETTARQMLRDPSSKYTVRIGRKYLANRKLLEKHLDELTRQ